MIVSVSCRTDVPAFYGEWFMRRLDAGYCRARNPFGGRPYTVSLEPGDVGGFIFCSKNMQGFMGPLAEVCERGFPFTVQYTINGYPRELEPHVPDPARSTGHMGEIAGLYGKRAAVWRYDTVVFSSITDPTFHLRNFESIAERLKGATDEVVVSFVQLYRKTVRNLDRTAREHDFEWWDPPAREKMDLLERMAKIARGNGMGLSVCAQKELLVDGTREAVCIDPVRMSDVAGHQVLARAKSHRKTCGCFESKDIGAYDTCLHGCAYCYGVNSRSAALARYRKHDPLSDSLSGDVAPGQPGCFESRSPDCPESQATLF